MNDVVLGGEESSSKTRDMVRAQNDLYMVVPNDGAEANANEDDTLSSLEEGRLTVGELQRSAANICRFLIDAPAFGRKIEWKQSKVEAKLYKALAGFEGVEDEEIITRNLRKIHIVTKDKAKIIFKVDDTATYQVISSVMSMESSLAQMVCNIRLNGEDLATVQTNGTDGRYIRQQLLQVNLEQGFYELELEFVKPGMVMQCVDFERVSFG